MISNNNANGKGVWVICTLLVSFLAGVQAASATGCSAQITLNSTYPGHAFYLYYDVIVHNTGSCGITKVYVSITLPPDQQPFAYYNISNQTGELNGFSRPMPSGRAEVGGTFVLTTARVPEVTLLSAECSATCNPVAGIPSSPPIKENNSSIKVEVKPGSNRWWLALNLNYYGTATRRVHFREANSTSWIRMNTENWGTEIVYTYSASSTELDLPLSLQLASVDGETVILDDLITSFANGTVDTNVTYGNATTLADNNDNNDNNGGIQLSVLPDSNSQYIGVILSSTFSEIASIAIKAQNSDWMDMESPSETSNIFELFTAEAMVPPLSVQLTSTNKDVIVLGNAIPSFDSQTISTGLQF